MSADARIGIILTSVPRCLLTCSLDEPGRAGPAPGADPFTYVAPSIPGSLDAGANSQSALAVRRASVGFFAQRETL